MCAKKIPFKKVKILLKHILLDIKYRIDKDKIQEKYNIDIDLLNEIYSYIKIKSEINKEKYFDLVWYARKDKSRDGEYWKNTTKDIKEKAFKQIIRIEKQYKDETINLNSELGDFYPGFNSGMLACIRYIAEEDRELAEDEFPFLDT